MFTDWVASVQRIYVPENELVKVNNPPSLNSMCDGERWSRQRYIYLYYNNFEINEAIMTRT